MFFMSNFCTLSCCNVFTIIYLPKAIACFTWFFFSVFLIFVCFVLQDGNGVVRGNYLSVFLELSAGLPETSK